jgi:hypothetical protein
MATHSIDIGPPAGADPDLFTQTWASNKTASLVIGRDRAVVLTHLGDGVTAVEVSGSQYLAGRSLYAIQMPEQDPNPIPANTGIPFPNNTFIGAPSTVINRIDSRTFALASGAYQISWNVNIIEPAQLRIAATTGAIVGSIETTVGRADANSQARGECVIQVTTAFANIQLRNDTAGDINLSSDPGDLGGPNSAFSYLTITRIS